MAKRLVFCFDGTWNELSADEPTNVAKLAQMVRPTDRKGNAQIVYYDEGLGTNTTTARRLVEGATGTGLMLNLREAYRFLIFNYEPGDALFAFGFSRGAFTARSFVGLVRHAGILDIISANQIERAIEIYRHAPAGQTGKESDDALSFRLTNCRDVCVSEEDRRYRMQQDPSGGHENAPLIDIQYVGVWDTVAALGIPAFIPGAKAINGKYRFHDAKLTSKIKAARHAVAIDEHRRTFKPTLFDRQRLNELNTLAQAEREDPFKEWEVPYQERWFPGVHGTVGGMTLDRGLSDGALAWVLAGAKRQGLDLRDDEDAKTFQIAPNSFGPLSDNAKKQTGDGWITRLKKRITFHREGPSDLDEVSLPTLQRWAAPANVLPEGRNYRPETMSRVARAIEDWIATHAAESKSEHVVRKGDTLYAIAQRFLGDGNRYPEIFEANRDRIDDPAHIMPGMTLRVVDETSGSGTAPADSPD